MAVIAPQTDLYLIKSPLEIDEINQLTFSNATAQHNYFNSLPKISVDDFTYQRKDGTIRYGGNFDELIGYNYCMYRNDAFSNKWFYAFITGMEYLNDSVTAITIKTDVWQTWQFDLNYKPVFVEREHVNNDTVGIHTLPENLELGEYIVNGAIINSDLNPATTETNLCWICFQVSDFPDGRGILDPTLGDDVRGRLIGGVYSGLTYLMVLTASDANRLIQCYDLAGKSDAIVAIFQVPFGAILSENISIVNHSNDIAGNITIAEFTSSTSVPITIDSMTISKPSSLTNYQPKNNKMLTHPFCYFYVSNNSGTEIPFNYEDFSSNPTFKIDGVVSQGMSIKAYPTNYKNTSNIGGYNFGISCGKIPICAWNSDYYTNWVTQNAVNFATQWKTTAISSIVDVAGGFATGGLAGGALGTVGAAKNIFETAREQMLARTTAKLVPDQAQGNVNCGDVNMAENRFGYTIYPMCIKPEYAKIIDDYFTMYGYKVNEVKLPNITGRRNWNYVKTIGCYIDGDIPQDDMEEIKNMFNNGVTFWHNPATFADYSQNNDII